MPHQHQAPAAAVRQRCRGRALCAPLGWHCQQQPPQHLAVLQLLPDLLGSREAHSVHPAAAAVDSNNLSENLCEAGLEISSPAGRWAALLTQLDRSLELARDLAAASESEEATEVARTVQQRLADLSEVVGRLVPQPQPSSVTSLYGKVYQLKKS